MSKLRNRIKELRYVRAGSLRENERNWRRHPDFQRSALEAVLAEIGISDALIAYEVDGELTLIDGHLRKDLGDDVEWPVLVLDVDDAEADKLLATLDPLAGLAEADADVLEALLATVETEDAALTKMLEELAAEAGIVPELPPAPEAQVDKAAELQEKWGTALGQVWELGEHRLACGDCTDEAVVEAVMRGERADLGLTSPPYAVGKEYEVGVSFDQHLALLRGFADMALAVIKVGGFLFTNFGEIAPQSHAKPLTGSGRQCLYPISKDYWQIFHVERGMDLYAMRIWYKPFNRLQQPFWTYHTSIPHHQEWEHIWTWRLPGGGDDE